MHSLISLVASLARANDKFTKVYSADNRIVLLTPGGMWDVRTTALRWPQGTGGQIDLACLRKFLTDAKKIKAIEYDVQGRTWAARNKVGASVSLTWDAIGSYDVPEWPSYDIDSVHNVTLTAAAKKALTAHTSTDPSRPGINYWYLGGGSITATDGYRLLRLASEYHVGLVGLMVPPEVSKYLTARKDIGAVGAGKMEGNRAVFLAGDASFFAPDPGCTFPKIESVLDNMGQVAFTAVVDFGVVKSAILPDQKHVVVTCDNEDVRIGNVVIGTVEYRGAQGIPAKGYGVNPKYFIDALEAVGAVQTVTFRSDLQPISMVGAVNGMALVMPIRL